ncbi:MAG TPA: hypothetical protein VI790_01075 [Candidatus Nanoarchaeia archaeon]|nr:hypothetical protein [Candidatus Nanoarchaeia archaeon]
MKFFKDYPCAIPLLFLLAYGIPILALIPHYSPDVIFFSRLIGLIAFLNVFTQVMLGSFRAFFKTYYNPIKVFYFHNILGLTTLILVIIHALTQPNIIQSLTFNANTDVNLGVIALYIMTITVITSDLKYFFKVDYSTIIWRGIHLLNYSLLPILFFHALNLSLAMKNIVVYCLFIFYLAIVIIGGFYKIKRITHTKSIL